MFDPENIARFDALEISPYGDAEQPEGEPIVVLGSDYDQLLALYRDLQQRMNQGMNDADEVNSPNYKAILDGTYTKPSSDEIKHH